MKIHELSKITGVHIETIRSYRQKGLLHPTQSKNGYYEYSNRDYVSLLYLKKLRSFSFSLEDIEKFYSSASEEELLTLFDKEASTLKAKIKELQSQLSLIEFEKQHILESESTIKEKVTLFESIDDKIDVYELEQIATLNPTLSIRDFYGKTTQTLFIKKEVLNGPCLDQMIPMNVGVGTYRYIIDEGHINIPDNAILTPHGLYICQVIAITDLSEINIQKLQPMMDFAKKNHFTFISDTTAYLMHIHEVDSKLVYFFRIRACVKQTENTQPFPPLQSNQ